MNRLIPIFAALAVLAGPLAPGGAAVAKDHDGGGRGSDRGADRGDRGGDRGDRGGDRGGGGRGGDRGGGDRGGQERRSYDPGPDRGRGGPNWRDGRGGPERYDRRAYDEPPPQYAPSPHRGGYMPPQAGGAMPDYGRYRLRPPPRGFVWVRTGNGFAMVSTETGRVFDVVPN